MTNTLPDPGSLQYWLLKNEQPIWVLLSNFGKRLLCFVRIGWPIGWEWFKDISTGRDLLPIYALDMGFLHMLHYKTGFRCIMPIENLGIMYCMYKITDEASLRSAIDRYMKFYAKERPQERFHCKTPLEVRSEALSVETPTQYPIAENKRIEAYKAKWCA